MQRRPPAPLPLPAFLAVLALAGLTLAGCGGRDRDATAPTSVVVPTTAPEPSDEASTSVVEPTGPTTTGAGDPDEASTTEAATSTATDATDATWARTTYRLVEVARVDFPTAMAVRPGHDDLWVAERAGRVRRIEPPSAPGGGSPTGEVADEPVVDLTDLVGTGGEGGLLGLTFSADGDDLYLSYTNRRGDSTVAEYPLVDDRVDDASSRILLQVDQPYSNHNGGQVTVGPDGLLYVALGDGGSGGDPLDSGQDTTTLLGSILRIDPADPAGEAGYGIPVDNPYADGEGGRPEIWIHGVRNPWRFSFDRANGDLWIADVGQNAIEEIDHLPADGGPAGRGANLGWRVMEGDRVFDPEAAPLTDHTGPIYTYDHRDGRCSVTGGYVYRGGRIPDLGGVYLFADYCSGELFGLQAVDDGVLVADLVTDVSPGPVISFGEDADGELYVLEAGGAILRLDGPG
jgi:glucose/arabinose dehydrogenase